MFQIYFDFKHFFGILYFSFTCLLFHSFFFVFFSIELYYIILRSENTLYLLFCFLYICLPCCCFFFFHDIPLPLVLRNYLLTFLITVVATYTISFGLLICFVSALIKSIKAKLDFSLLFLLYRWVTFGRCNFLTKRLSVCNSWIIAIFKISSYFLLPSYFCFHYSTSVFVDLHAVSILLFSSVMLCYFHTFLFHVLNILFLLLPLHSSF